jgi:hypothetical protein
MEMNYYWNDIPGEGKCRNNLIYTSLISDDKKTFCQWYYNDEGYHGGQNEVVDPNLMQEKMNKESFGLRFMKLKGYQHLIPEFTISTKEKKIYFDIDGIDFWNKAKCNVENYSKVIPNWEQQMLDILQAHKNIGMYKYSLHPSSYFIIDGKLKSFNYFFHYLNTEGPVSIANHASHIYSTRQSIMKEQVEAMGISWNDPEPLVVLQHLCFESFITNYTDSFINQAKEIYSD